MLEGKVRITVTLVLDLCLVLALILVNSKTLDQEPNESED